MSNIKTPFHELNLLISTALNIQWNSVGPVMQFFIKKKEKEEIKTHLKLLVYDNNGIGVGM